MWVRTRYCGCGNCRYHSPRQPGWDKCPDRNKPDFDRTASWLWRRDYSGERAQ